MSVTSLQSPASDDTQDSESAKRGATREPAGTPDPKRVKTDHFEAEGTDIQQQETSLKPTSESVEDDGYEVRVAKNDGSHESTILLTGAKRIFQNGLPFMNAEYVARLVYDRAHTTLVMVKPGTLEVKGGLCFREFRSRGFAEISFAAVSPEHSGVGNGALLMAHLKDYLRASGPVMHLLTYADNTAIGYFKKQGFSKEIDLAPSVWKGVIKDYVGGTLVHCAMLPRIRYLQVHQMLRLQKETVLAKIKAQRASNEIIHQPPPQWTDGTVITPIDPMSIPAIRATGWTKEKEAETRQLTALDSRCRSKHYPDMHQLLTKIHAHRSAWPFLSPVDGQMVPDYYDIVKKPMALSIIGEKLEKGAYNDEESGPADMLEDLKLMFANCRLYNKPGTTYVRAGRSLENYMWKMVAEVPEWYWLLPAPEKK